MKKGISISLLIVVVSLYACKTSKSNKKNETISAKSTESLVTDSVVIKDTVAKKDQGPMYDLIVSFISIGSGIDGKSVKILDNFIIAFQQDKNVIITYKRIAWGREGETEYCFSLANLSKEMKEKFTVNVKSYFLDNQLIALYENEYFTHKMK